MILLYLAKPFLFRCKSKAHTNDDSLTVWIGDTYRPLPDELDPRCERRQDSKKFVPQLHRDWHIEVCLNPCHD